MVCRGASKRKRPLPENESSNNRRKDDKAPAMPLTDKNIISSVLIKVGQGKSYADVLGKLRNK